MLNIFMTIDIDHDDGYPVFRAEFDNSDPEWPNKARESISNSAIPAYRLSWFTADDDSENLELVGDGSDLF